MAQEHTEAADKAPKLNPNYKAESGEENETRVLEVEMRVFLLSFELVQAAAKLYCFVKGEGATGTWQERGSGSLHLNDSKVENKFSSRIGTQPWL